MTMTMTIVRVLRTSMVGVLMVCGTGVAAQQPPTDVVFFEPMQETTGAVSVALAGGQEAALAVMSFDAVSMGRVVTDAPYTAEAVTELTQTLADGNRIEQRSTTTIARDSRGRTRREQSGLAVGPVLAGSTGRIVTISDPTAGTHVTLNLEDKLAFRSKGMAMFDRGVPPPPPPPPPSGVGAVERGMIVERGPMVERGAMAEPGMRVERGTMAGPAGGATWSIASAPTSDVQRDVRTEALQPRAIEGVQAQGTLTTVTIPAGAIGNAQPIEIVTEQWFSPELQIVMLTRRSDPRFGETVYRVTNLQRAEPSADLFAVPADFRVKGDRVPEP